MSSSPCMHPSTAICTGALGEALRRTPSARAREQPPPSPKPGAGGAAGVFQRGFKRIGEIQRSLSYIVSIMKNPQISQTLTLRLKKSSPMSSPLPASSEVSSATPTASTSTVAYLGPILRPPSSARRNQAECASVAASRGQRVARLRSPAASAAAVHGGAQEFKDGRG